MRSGPGIRRLGGSGATLAVAIVLALNPGGSRLAALDPPHDASRSIECSSCHTPHSAAGGVLTTVLGNANLCMSCHLTGGPATAFPFAEADQALPAPGLPSGVTPRGTSHRWDSGPAGWVEKLAGNGSPGAVGSTGVFTGRFAKTYTITITVGGDVGAARFDWSATTPGGGSGSNVPTGAAVALDEGVSAAFSDGQGSPSFLAGSQWRIYVRTDLSQPSDPEMALRLENGKLMCSTCHNQHSQERTPFDPDAPAWGGPGTGEGRHFQRVDNQLNQMCVDCHSVRNVLSASAGSHPVGVASASYCNYCHGPQAGLRGLPLPLSADHTLGCITCHAPHYSPSADGTLAQSSDLNLLCTTCHWSVDDSAEPVHFSAASGARWPGGQYGSTFPAVAAARTGFCTNCHQPHGWPDDDNPAQDYRTLLVDFEEGLCFTCHDGSPVVQDVRSEFQKSSTHPLTLTAGVHLPGEAAVVNSPDRHVECDDCHNSHWAKPRVSLPGPSATPRAADGPLRYARGVNLAGTQVLPAAFEYQVCLRCHGTSSGMPVAPTPRQYRPSGAVAHTNTALEFGGGFSSFHSVAVTGTVNDHVPSLYNGWTKTSYLACTSCHNNDDGATGSGGPNYRDEFSSVAYNGTNGTQNWAPSPWVESDSGGSGAGGGNIRVGAYGQCASGNCLRIEARTVNDAVDRQADLTGALTATLSVRFTNELAGTDQIRLEISGDGGGSWSQLKNYTSANTGTGTDSFDVTDFVAANTRLRFRVLVQNQNQRLWIDNVDLSYTNSGGGSGPPNGPHGSAWPSLLERRFETGDPSTYQQAKYALCFKCHDSSVVLDGSTSFEEHDKHIVSEDTSCNVCHDPHASQGQKFLINFDTSVVTPSSGRLEFNPPPVTGGSGSCYLVCHGKNHNPETYNSNY